MAHMTTIQQARSRLLIHQTFWAQLLLAVPLIKQPAHLCPTLQTDMKVIEYSDEFVESVPMDVVMFALAHEICHIIMVHGLRRGGRELELWNISCDYAVNYILEDCGFTLWDKCYFDRRFAGMSAEQIHDILKAEGGADKARDPKKRSSGGNKGEPGGGMPGDLLERATSNMAPEERAAVEQGIRQLVVQAATLSRGSMPAGLARLVDGILNPVVPWYALLRNHLTKLSRTSFDWSRRNRRVKDFFIPRKRGKAMGELIVIGDTSGSISGKVLARAGAEIQSAAMTIKPERIRVIWADDTECAGQQVFEAGDTIVMKPVGGGGTDMRKAMKYVERYDPIVVVMITDADTPWPKVPPSYQFIVLCTTKQRVPNYAQVVRLP